MSAAAPDPTGVQIPTDRTFLSHRERSELSGDAKDLEKTLADPAAKIEDRQAVIKQLLRVKSDLDSLQPPETTPDQRTALAKEEVELREAWMVGMPSQAEMRRCPAGAIGKHSSWEKRNKDRIRRWKNVMRVLHKGDDDPDLSNIERFRGTNSTLGLETAQVPAKAIFISPDTPQYKENYERTFGNGEPAANGGEVQALKDEIADLKAKLAPEKTASSPRPTYEGELLTSKCGKNTELRGIQGLESHARRCNACLAMDDGVESVSD